MHKLAKKTNAIAKYALFIFVVLWLRKKGNYFIGLVGQREELSNYFIIELMSKGNDSSSLKVHKLLIHFLATIK